jgi:1-acyl-sn-glycerol-3-phosphate acyltransferase
MNTLQIYFSFLYPFEIIPTFKIRKGTMYNVHNKRRSLIISWLFIEIDILYNK